MKVEIICANFNYISINNRFRNNQPQKLTQLRNRPKAREFKNKQKIKSKKKTKQTKKGKYKRVKILFAANGN